MSSTYALPGMMPLAARWWPLDVVALGGKLGDGKEAELAAMAQPPPVSFLRSMSKFHMLLLKLRKPKVRTPSLTTHCLPPLHPPPPYPSLVLPPSSS